MIVDILREIEEKRLSSDEAYDLLLKITEETHSGRSTRFQNYRVDGNQIDLAAIIGMDKYEYTAYAHGADLLTITEWRCHGWPTHCRYWNHVYIDPLNTTNQTLKYYRKVPEMGAFSYLYHFHGLVRFMKADGQTRIGTMYTWNI